MKFKADIPYLTMGERSNFKKLVDSGDVSFFRLGSCEVCGADIPKIKRFCSWDCYREAQEDGGENDQGEVD